MFQLSPLYKIPLILWSSLCVQVTCTAPNPPAEKTEQARYGAKSDVIGLARGKSPLIKKGITHLFNAAEIVSILASERYPVLTKLGHPLILNAPGAMRVTPLYAVSIFFMTVAVAIRVACYHELGRYFTFELSIKKDHKLVTTGPYSFVRHPSYTACTLYLIAALVSQLGPGSWWYESGYWGSVLGQLIALSWIYFMGPATILFFLRRTVQEDSMLRKEFKTDWDRWSQHTPYRIIPYVWW